MELEYSSFPLPPYLPHPPFFLYSLATKDEGRNKCGRVITADSNLSSELRGARWPPGSRTALPCLPQGSSDCLPSAVEDTSFGKGQGMVRTGLSALHLTAIVLQLGEGMGRVSACGKEAARRVPQNIVEEERKVGEGFWLAQ